MPAPNKPGHHLLAHKQGQFLIEVVIAVGVMLMFVHAFFTLITASYQILAQSRSQVAARAIATEKMEIIRNLSYDDVGTQGGVPPGNLLQEETAVRNGQSFNVYTSIIYQDDPYDNLAPTDTLPADYKTARVQVTWNNDVFPNQQQITLITDISPYGVESNASGGTLRLLAFDSHGAPVPQASFHISAPSATPPVDLIQVADDFGMVEIIGTPACTSCYSITVTKTDYSTDRTYTTSEVANPSQPPLSVLENEITQASFSIDQLAQVNFYSVSPGSSNYQALGNIDFHLTGSKTIGTDSGGNPVYKLDQSYTTDASGYLSLQLESDSYTLDLDNVNYDLGGSLPFSPVAINSASNVDVKFIAASHHGHSLLTQIQDASGTPIPLANVRIYDLNFDGSDVAGDVDLPDSGQVLFTPLNEDIYTLEVTHQDYDDYSTSATISGPTKEIVIMNPK